LNKTDCKQKRKCYCTV